jgi:hypothetical protein
VATACLGLVALQAVSTRGGSGRVASLLTDINGVVERVLDPKVPAIPDRSVAAGAARSVAAGNAGPAQAMPVNPAAAAQGSGRTQTNYPTNGFPFPIPPVPHN